MYVIDQQPPADETPFTVERRQLQFKLAARAGVLGTTSKAKWKACKSWRLWGVVVRRSIHHFQHLRTTGPEKPPRQAQCSNEKCGVQPRRLVPANACFENMGGTFTRYKTKQLESSRWGTKNPNGAFVAGPPNGFYMQGYMGGMMGGGMMMAMGLFWVLLAIVLVLGAAALIKYLRH